MTSPDFWNNNQNEEVLKDYKKFRGLLEEYENLKKKYQQKVELQQIITLEEKEFSNLEKDKTNIPEN